MQFVADLDRVLLGISDLDMSLFKVLGIVLFWIVGIMLKNLIAGLINLQRSIGMLIWLVLMRKIVLLLN